jgi:E3 ubiquitin-protein ligase RNF216
MVQCPDGHMFCKACICAFSQERLGSRNAKIKCMDQDNCPLEISHGQLKLCLPAKLFTLYERIKQDEEIAAAGLDNLEECPFCDYKCVMENEMERLFHCMNEDCGEVSCRQCKKKVGRRPSVSCFS